MPYYLDIIDGKTHKTPKRGRPRKGYSEVTEGVYMRVAPIKVLLADTSFPIKRVMNWVISSNIERSPDRISFFLCQISPSCEVEAMREVTYMTRIDFDLNSGDMLCWYLQYDKNRPDIIIQGAFHKEEA